MPKQRENSAMRIGPRGNPAKVKPHQWKKGQPSPNPKGRPKGEDLTTKIRAVMAEDDEEFGTKADKLIARAVECANAGDFRFFKEIIDRMDGKVPDRIANADGSMINLLPIKLDGDREV